MVLLEPMKANLIHILAPDIFPTISINSPRQPMQTPMLSSSPLQLSFSSLPMQKILLALQLNRISASLQKINFLTPELITRLNSTSLQRSLMRLSSFSILLLKTRRREDFSLKIQLFRLYSSRYFCSSLLFKSSSFSLMLILSVRVCRQYLFFLRNVSSEKISMIFGSGTGGMAFLRSLMNISCSLSSISLTRFTFSMSFFSVFPSEREKPIRALFRIYPTQKESSCMSESRPFQRSFRVDEQTLFADEGYCLCGSNDAWVVSQFIAVAGQE